MRLRHLIPAACLLFTAGAFGTAPASAAMLTEEVCKKLHAHERAGNVAYQPGVTARGKRVRRASARPGNAPRPAGVDISILLQDRCRFPANPKLFKGEIPVSRLFVRSDGRMNYAGQPLSINDQQEISTICGTAWGG